MPGVGPVTDVTWIAPVSTGIATVLAVVLTGRWNRRIKAAEAEAARAAAEIAARAAPYDQLADRLRYQDERIDKLQGRIERLEAELEAAEDARREAEHERDRLADALDQARRLVFIMLRFVDKHVPEAIRRPWTRPAWLDEIDTPV